METISTGLTQDLHKRIKELELVNNKLRNKLQNEAIKKYASLKKYIQEIKSGGETNSMKRTLSVLESKLTQIFDGLQESLSKKEMQSCLVDANIEEKSEHLTKCETEANQRALNTPAFEGQIKQFQNDFQMGFEKKFLIEVGSQTNVQNNCSKPTKKSYLKILRAQKKEINKHLKCLWDMKYQIELDEKQYLQELYNDYFNFIGDDLDSTYCQSSKEYASHNYQKLHWEKLKNFENSLKSLESKFHNLKHLGDC